VPDLVDLTRHDFQIGYVLSDERPDEGFECDVALAPGAGSVHCFGLVVPVQSPAETAGHRIKGIAPPHRAGDNLASTNVPALPAICNDCGRLWVPNALFMGPNVSQVEIESFTVSPCPHCGGQGHIPDGIYDATAEGIRVMVTSAKSAASLARLAALLQQARALGAASEAVAEAIERDTPEFAGLAAVVRRLKGVPIATWIGIALATLALLQGMSADERLRDIEGKVDRVLQQVSTPAASPAPRTPAPAESGIPRVGRNDPCPCGSGRKYKRCHGRTPTA
jgi:hypothetical protein